MSSVVISGDTSGSVTLQAPAVSGATVLTLPATSGTVLTTASGTASSATTATNITGGVAGAVPYQSGAGATNFSAAGTSGQLLQSNGVSAPSWVTPTPGALVLLSTVTASASATVDIESTFSSTYDEYLLIVTGLRVGTAGSELQARLKASGVYATTNYAWANSQTTGSIYNGNSSGSDTKISIAPDLMSTQQSNFQIYINQPANTSFFKNINWTGVVSTSTYGAAQMAVSAMGTQYSNTAALTGIRFLASAGNIAAGTFRLYGLANS